MNSVKEDPKIQLPMSESGSKPKSPIKTCSERMAWIFSRFGPPRTKFEPQIVPREIDVIQVWMSTFDNFASGLGKKILSASSKSEVINQTIELLTNHMENLDATAELMDKRSLKTRFTRLITRADNLVRSNQGRKDDSEWILTKVKEYSKVFDITVTAKLDTPLSPKRKLEDDEDHFFPVSIQIRSLRVFLPRESRFRFQSRFECRRSQV